MQPNDLPRTAADPYPETNYRTHFYRGPTELYNCVLHAGDLKVLAAGRATTDSLEFPYIETGYFVVWASNIQNTFDSSHEIIIFETNKCLY